MSVIEQLEIYINDHEYFLVSNDDDILYDIADDNLKIERDDENEYDN